MPQLSMSAYDMLRSCAINREIPTWRLCKIVLGSRSGLRKSPITDTCRQRQTQESEDPWGEIPITTRFRGLDSKAAPASEEKPLDTVSVPEQFRPIFSKAQQYVEQYFSQRVEDPRHSSILISGERYILVRAASMSVEFFDLVTSLYQDKGPEEARKVASNLLFDVAHAIGKADARSFHEKMGVTHPIERLSVGPIHFSFSGWSFVEILPESHPSPDQNCFLIYDHLFSFELDAWRQHGRKVEQPVCVMSAGYASGWCEESFGIRLVAVEVECQAMGDAHCRFCDGAREKIEAHLERYWQSSQTQPK